MSSHSTKVQVVIDPGTYQWRLGFAGMDKPRAIFSTDTSYLDNTAIIEDGIVVGIEETESAVQYYDHYIRHGLQRLKCHPQDSDICLAVPLQMRDSFRRQMAESVMEGIGANSVFFISQPLLAGYASGSATCTVVDCGYMYTSVMGMLNFYPVPESQLLLPLGGRDLDRYLMHLSPKALRQLSTDEVAYIKRHYCSVAPTLISTSLRKRTTCLLPDGSQITLSSELQMGSEMLFNPSLAGLADVPPIDQSIIDAVFSVPDNRAYTLLRMVFSSGGSLKLPGFSSRLKQCLLNRTASKLLDTVKKNPHSELAVWWGGSVFASLSTFKKMCITRAEYEEEGPGIVSNRWL